MKGEITTKHKVAIKVSNHPIPEGVVAVKKTSIKKRILNKLFGTSQKVTIIVPGDSVEGISIYEIPEGGNANG